MSETKVCNDCWKEKPLEYFRIHSSSPEHKNYYHGSCRECEYARSNAKRVEIGEYIRSIKENSVCKKCGYSDHRALVFHHRNPAEKKYNVSSMRMSSYSLKTVQAEIDKCDILCQNCHAIVHYNQ